MSKVPGGDIDTKVDRDGQSTAVPVDFLLSDGPDNFRV